MEYLQFLILQIIYANQKRNCQVRTTIWNLKHFEPEMAFFEFEAACFNFARIMLSWPC